jgi:phosphoribosylformylglycinamidine synthase
LLDLLAAPDICAKTWVYEQYDQVVGSGTVARPGGDAGVVRLTPSERGIAVALDGDGARVALDPRRGGAEAVAQAALNVACSGAQPVAVTNCLNFGNPERPGTAYALREVITGMAEACEVLGTPVVSGNVSLYNESGGRPIHPTPVVGCVGVLERANAAVPAAPADRGRALFALGTAAPAYDGSEWQALVSGSAAGRIPEVDLPALRWLCDLLGELAREGVLGSAHDVSDGGLAVALAEIALACGSGLEATIEPEGDAAARLFGECCGLVVVSCAPADEARLVEACDAAEVPLEKIGGLGGTSIALRCGELALDVPLEAARAAYDEALPRAMAAG